MKRALIIGATYLFPIAALAQTFGQGQIKGYLGSIVNFINGVIIPLIIAAAILMFIWGMFRYFIFGADDEGSRDAGKSLIIWGLVGFVMILTVQGIVRLLADATGFAGGGNITPPTVPGIRY